MQALGANAKRGPEDVIVFVVGDWSFSAPGEPPARLDTPTFQVS
jgi:hypothetical protein